MVSMYKENKVFFLSDVSFESVYRKRGRIFSENKEILLTPVKRKVISPIPRSTYSMIASVIISGVPKPAPTRVLTSA